MAGERDKVRGTVTRKGRRGERRKEKVGRRQRARGMGEIKNGENAVGGEEEKENRDGEK